MYVHTICSLVKIVQKNHSYLKASADSPSLIMRINLTQHHYLGLKRRFRNTF